MDGAASNVNGQGAWPELKASASLGINCRRRRISCGETGAKNTLLFLIEMR